MDTQRLVIFFVFFFSLYFLLDGWQRDRQQAVPAQQQSTPTAATTATPPDDIPAAVSRPSQEPPRSAAGQESLPAQSTPTAGGQTLRVETDLLIAEIDTVGGELKSVALRTQRDTFDAHKPFTLLTRSGEETYVAQSGLIGEGMPTHRTLWTPDPAAASAAPGVHEMVLVYRAPNGVEVRKRYVFHDGSYLIDVDFDIANRGQQPLAADAYFQLVRDGKPPPGLSAMVRTFFGFAWFTKEDKFKKVTLADIDKYKQPFSKKASDGWIALLQHYFLSAWLPPDGVAREFYIRKLDNGLYAGGVIVPIGTVAPDATAQVRMPLYVGPQEQDKFETMAPGLDLTVDYGVLTIIAKPLFALLSWIHGLVGNWGIAIIVLTVIVKGLFFPLSAASYRSMAKMRVIAPKLQKLKEQHGGDRQRMNQAMMEMYKTEKINPLGGCLPILVQVPVFISLYWVLLASVELRHAPFYGWINDLSQPDPYYILPLIMGATMILQTMLNPVPPDPVQAKVMKIMPVAFSVFFFFFPAGLVLYWLVNNILSIAQQWAITRAVTQKAAG